MFCGGGATAVYVRTREPFFPVSGRPLFRLPLQFAASFCPGMPHTRHPVKFHRPAIRRTTEGLWEEEGESREIRVDRLVIRRDLRPSRSDGSCPSTLPRSNSIERLFTTRRKGYGRRRFIDSLCRATISTCHRSSANGAAVEFASDLAAHRHSSQHGQQQQLFAAELRQWFVVRPSIDSHRVHGVSLFCRRIAGESPEHLPLSDRSRDIRGPILRYPPNRFRATARLGSAMPIEQKVCAE